MKKTVIILLISLFYQNVSGQIYWRVDEENEQIISEIDTADIDGDNLTDTLYYDFQKRQIMVLLSSRNYVPMAIKWKPEDWWETCDLGAYDGGIAVSYHHMRVDGGESYVYEKESNRFRLVEIYESYHGPNGYYHDISYDLSTNTFEADWIYMDRELAQISNDYSILIPTVKINLFNPPVYIGDDFRYDDDMRVEYLRIFYQNKSMIDRRMEVIDKEMLLKTEMPVLRDEELLEYGYSTDEPISYDRISMSYDPTTLQFTISNVDLYDDYSYGYFANIAALPPYKQHKLFLLSFDFPYGSSAIVMYMLDNEGKCSDYLTFWYEEEEGERIDLMIDDSYEISVEKKKKQNEDELAKYFIDTLKCKFIEK